MKRIPVGAASTRSATVRAKAKMKRVFRSEVLTFRCSKQAGQRKS